MHMCLHTGCRVSGGELFEDIVHRDYYSEADARLVRNTNVQLVQDSVI